jgi:hypothetical protein
MSEQPPLDATFYAFRKRERRFVMTGAALGYCVLALLAGAAFIALTWGLWGELIAWYFGLVGAIRSGAEPAGPPQSVLVGLAPYYLAMLPIGFMLFAAFEAACLRWLVRGEAGGGLLGLKLDADTWRVFAVYWLWVGYAIGAVLAIAAFYALLLALGGLGSLARFLAILIGALAPIGIAALLIWGGVVFAPAAATSIGRRKLTFLSARRVSGPRYWPLLTAFVLVIVGYMIAATIVSSVLQIPFNSAMAPVMQAMLSGADGAEALSLMQEALMTPLMLGVFAVNVAVSFVLATVYHVALFGVNARAFEAAAEAGDVARG